MRKFKGARVPMPAAIGWVCIQPLEARRMLAADRFEPNNNFPAATDLGTVETHTEAGLSIDPAGDIDVFRFQPAVGGSTTITIAFSNAVGDLDLLVFDSAFRELAVSAGTDDVETVTVGAAVGPTYYVRV